MSAQTRAFLIKWLSTPQSIDDFEETKQQDVQRRGLADQSLQKACVEHLLCLVTANAILLQPGLPSKDHILMECLINYIMESFVYDIDSIRGLNLSKKVPLPIFAYLVEESFKFSIAETNAFSLSSFESIFEREAVPLTPEERRFCINSLVYMVRFLQKKAIQPDHINRWLTENTLIPEEHRSFFVQVYTNHTQLEVTKKSLSLGKIKELRWTVNKYQGDTRYPNFKRIYILLDFHIQNEEGVLERQIVNLSLQEFKVLQAEIKEIGEILGSFKR